MNDTLALGATYSAALHGIAGAWTVHGTATVWDVHQADGQQRVLVQLSSHHRPGRRSHTAYACGTVNVLPDGRREIVSILTPQPGPTRIGLGWQPLDQRDPAEAAHHIEQAAKELADWEPIPDDDSPLGVSALTWLARAVQRAAAGREADAERDLLVRRLRAGGVSREEVTRVDGRDPSRITQIAKPRARTNG